jgi:Transposase and inactivated derivatives, IS5 family
MPKRSEEKPGFADIAYESRRQKPSFLDKVNEIIDWRPVDKVLKKALRRKKIAPGNVPYPALNMFKILLLQNWYNLSDAAMEDNLADRASFSVFAGFSLDLPVPDSSTICRFRNSLLDAQISDKLFGIINDQLTAGNFIVKQGALLDASIVESSCRPRKTIDIEYTEPDEDTSNEDDGLKVEIRYSKDADARWTVKGGKPYYGYKIHAVTDDGPGFVLGCHVTSANVADTCEFAKLVDNAQMPRGASVSADKGYASQRNRDKLLKDGLVDHIMHKAFRNRPLSETQKALNTQLSKTRSKVERVFGTWKRSYGFIRTRYIGLAKVELELTLKAISFNIKKACLLKGRT